MDVVTASPIRASRVASANGAAGAAGGSGWLTGVTAARFAGASRQEVEAVRLYESACLAPRPRFLWGWVLHALDVTAVPGVDPGFSESARTAKFLAVVLVVILDDVADGGAEPGQVVAMCDAVFHGGPMSAVDGAHRSMTRAALDLYDDITGRVGRLPGYVALRDHLDFDVRQLANAMHYASLVNRCPSSGNVAENHAYQCHNMSMMVSGAVDLMARRDLDVEELGMARELVYTGQLMGRIGNAVSTWTREAVAGDFSSSFFAVLADRSGLPLGRIASLGIEEMLDLERQVGAKAALMVEWEQHRSRARAIASRIRGFCAGDYVDGLEQLLELHLASQGLK